MLNVTHAESAILMGQARHKRWLDRFTKQWSEPAMNAVVLRWWDNMDPQTKAQAKAQFPTEFAEIAKRIEAVTDREE